MGNTGEVSAIVAARELLDMYKVLDDEGKKNLFFNIEQNFNATPATVKLAYDTVEAEPSSTNLNRLYRASEPRRVELLRRLNQTPGTTHDLVGMRKDLLGLLREYLELAAVDENFMHLFRSWFSRCFAFFHPALTDEPLIFVEVALSNEIPGSIDSILNDKVEENVDPDKFTTATFYSISNCQPGLKNISFGNFLIKQVVEELKADFPSIKQFVTLSPIPGFKRWLDTDLEADNIELLELKVELRSLEISADNLVDHEEAIRKLVLHYLLLAKKGKHPLGPVARFHLGNGAQVHQVHGSADLSDKGLGQSYGAMVNYLYDLRYIERNHEQYVTEGKIEFNDKLRSSLLKS